MADPVSTSSEFAELPPLRILVAEDSAIIQRVITAQLARFGQEVDFVDNGAHASAAVQEPGQYDLVLLDICMPVQDGVDTAADITHRLGSERPRMVALTGTGDDEDRRRCLEAGMDDFIQKPANLHVMHQMLTDAVRHARA